MANDEELYLQIKKGNLSAFDVLYERYRIRLYRFIYSYLKNNQEAEDVFHEAFMKVLKSEIRVDFKSGTFQGWIFEVARNLSLNRIRSENRAEALVSGLPDEQVSPSPENALMNHANAERVQRAVSKLPEAQSQVLHLKLLGVNEKEIAKTLQIPLGTVKSRFNSLIQFIRQEVQE